MEEHHDFCCHGKPGLDFGNTGDDLLGHDRYFQPKTLDVFLQVVYIDGQHEIHKEKIK